MGAGDPDQVVLQLVTSTNRPYNTQLLADNLQTRGIKKPAVQRALDALVDQGKILCKECGKSKIYYPPQDNLPVLSEAQSADLKAKLSEAKTAVALGQEELKRLQAELASLSSSLSVEELKKEVERHKKEVAEMSAKLKGLQTGVRLVTPEERRKVERQFEAALEHWRKRRSMFRAVWDPITENMDKKESALMEEVGIENDDAAGVSLADMARLAPGGNKKRKA